VHCCVCTFGIAQHTTATILNFVDYIKAPFDIEGHS